MPFDDPANDKTPGFWERILPNRAAGWIALAGFTFFCCVIAGILYLIVR